MSPNPLKPRLIIISAPSGAGKTTLCDMLIKDFTSIALSLSTTTRPMRPTETDGVHYRFMTREEFKTRVDQGEFAEWAVVHNHWYGTPKDEIDRRIAAGKHVLFDIDVQGAMNLRKQYQDRALLIFIHPPSMEVLHKRLIERKGDSPAVIERRLQNAYNEVEQSKLFDYQITNDDLAKAYQDLKEIVKKECL